MCCVKVRCECGITITCMGSQFIYETVTLYRLYK
jgi:hypothetical protein